MFADDDDEEEEFGRSSAPAPERREERLDGFTNGRQVGYVGLSGGSDDRAKAPAPLVIAPAPNRDWREASRRVPSYRPETRREEIVTRETEVVVQRSGLRQLEVKQEDKVEAKEEGEETSQAAESIEVKTETKPMTLDEEALQAILAGEEEPSSNPTDDLIISHDEDAALHRDLPDLPDESTLEDYAAVPVEAFGAAILRGFGYDPKNDTKLHVPKPRPALLGIGATSLASELPPPSRKMKNATRGGRGYNAAGLLTPRDSALPSRDGSREVSVARSDREDSARERDRGSREDSLRLRDRNRSSREDSLAGTRRRRDDDDYGRERKRRERSYETDEERARRKAKERERDDRRDRDRDRDRDRRDDRDRYRDSERRDRDRNYDRDRRERR